MDQATILQKRKRVVKMSKEETLLVLRAYQAHPKNWVDVLEDVKGNVQQLSPEARDLYAKSTPKQLRDRISSKFGKLLLMDTNIKDIDIRNEVEKIKTAERRLVQRIVPQTPSVPDRRDTTVNDMSDDSDTQQEPNPIPLRAATDTPPGPIQPIDQQPGPAPRPVTVAASPSPATVAAAPSPATVAAAPSPATVDQHTGKNNIGRGRGRKRPLAALIRENQLAYNKFITKKVPKLLRELGVSSDDE